MYVRGGFRLDRVLLCCTGFLIIDSWGPPSPLSLVLDSGADERGGGPPIHSPVPLLFSSSLQKLHRSVVDQHFRHSVCQIPCPHPQAIDEDRQKGGMPLHARPRRSVRWLCIQYLHGRTPAGCRLAYNPLSPPPRSPIPCHPAWPFGPPPPSNKTGASSLLPISPPRPAPIPVRFITHNAFSSAHIKNQCGRKKERKKEHISNRGPATNRSQNQNNHTT